MIGMNSHQEGVFPMSWKFSGKCANDESMFKENKDLFFEKALIPAAKDYCKGCPVINECLQEGLKPNTTVNRYAVPAGVWGGQSERERRKFLRDLDKRLAVILEQTQAQLQDESGPIAS